MVRVRVGEVRLCGEAVQRNSKNTGIIDRLKPTGDWKIVEVVSSGLQVSRSA